MNVAPITALRQSGPPVRIRAISASAAVRRGQPSDDVEPTEADDDDVTIRPGSSDRTRGTLVDIFV
jgi:hypothetical protein